MNPSHQPGCATRRRALRLGLASGACLAAGFGWRAASAQPAKLSKQAVKYTDEGAAPGKDCDDCSQFVPGASATDAATCRIVEGTISPHGHCIAFTPKAKR
jgi:hypothetical protein